MAEFGEDGLDELADELEDFESELKSIRTSLDSQIEGAMEETAQRLGAEMEKEILDFNAVDSGELLNSIKVGRSGDGEYTWRVGPTADHARYVEYGTSAHTITPRGISESKVEEMSYNELEASGIRPIRFMADGKMVSTYKVDHPGTDKQPFFRNATDRAESREWLQKNLRRAIDRRFAEVL